MGKVKEAQTSDAEKQAEVIYTAAPVEGRPQRHIARRPGTQRYFLLDKTERGYETACKDFTVQEAAHLAERVVAGEKYAITHPSTLSAVSTALVLLVGEMQQIREQGERVLTNDAPPASDEEAS